MKGTLLIGRGVKRLWAAAVGFSSGDRREPAPFVVAPLSLSTLVAEIYSTVESLPK